MPAWIMTFLDWIVPIVIPMFFKDLEVRKSKLANYEAWKKTILSKGSEIAGEVVTAKAQEQELDKEIP